MNRRAITLVLSTALMLIMALVAAGPASAAPSKAAAKQKAKHARIVEYWTPARMANAKPRDFVKTKSGFKPTARGGERGKPPKGPGDGDDGGSGTSAVTGASWNGGGPALTATGKVFFTMGGTDYVCSGAAVEDNGSANSLVLTAGHCVYDETGHAYASKWMFFPGYDSAPSSCANSSHGCYSFIKLFAHPEYVNSDGFNSKAIKHDWGFADVGKNKQDEQLEDNVPEFSIEFSANDERRHSFGYPAQGKYGGSNLVYCEGDVITDNSYDTWGLECDMTPGSSGGPWIRKYGTASERALNSVNSYRYTGGQKKKYMFGPKFSTETEKTYDAATAWVTPPT
jgi:V8-like Glu-specific endopeptidase